MTILEEATILDVDLSLSPDFHWPCCRVDRFICGSHYHPDLDATRTDSELSCAECERMKERMRCDLQLPIHYHCPVQGGVCPFTEDGRIVRGSRVR